MPNPVGQRFKLTHYRWFSYAHLPEGTPRNVSAQCAELASGMIDDLPDSPELTAGLRHLLEAKDCFVRVAIAADEAGEYDGP